MTTTIENFQAVMATKAHPKMSEKYSFVDTAKIVSYFETEGWSVRRVAQTRARNIDEQSYTAHEVRMNLQSFSNVGDTLPELILTNSHNGKTPLKFQMGLFRLVCTNGLTVPMPEFNETYKIRHMGIDQEGVKVLTEQISTFLPLVGERVKRMQETEISKEATIEFLRESTKLRYPRQNYEFDYAEMVESLRDEDENTVWGAFNLAQEKLVNGLFNIKNGERTRKARPIKNFIFEEKMNVGIWNLAEAICLN